MTQPPIFQMINNWHNLLLVAPTNIFTLIWSLFYMPLQLLGLSAGARLGLMGAEACFSDDQTKLKWHLGQVGPTKCDSFMNRKKYIFT